MDNWIALELVALQRKMSGRQPVDVEVADGHLLDAHVHVVDEPRQEAQHQHTADPAHTGRLAVHLLAPPAELKISQMRNSDQVQCKTVMPSAQHPAEVDAIPVLELWV